jgi:hypothetical protein
MNGGTAPGTDLLVFCDRPSPPRRSARFRDLEAGIVRRPRAGAPLSRHGASPEFERNPFNASRRASRRARRRAKLAREPGCRRAHQQFLSSRFRVALRLDFRERGRVARLRSLQRKRRWILHRDRPSGFRRGHRRCVWRGAGWTHGAAVQQIGSDRDPLLPEERRDRGLPARRISGRTEEPLARPDACRGGACESPLRALATRGRRFTSSSSAAPRRRPL